MMRSWFKQNAKTILIASAAISVVAHIAIVTGWVIGTLPTPGLPENSIANRIFYIPPPDRVVSRVASSERVTYVHTDAAGTGVGEGPRMAGEARPSPTPDPSLGKPTEQKDTIASAPIAPTSGPDSVYSILEVDTAVVRSSSSAAPAYPLKLLEQHIQGYVNAQYVVDTTGFADTASFTVLKATNKEFVTAVKEALPYMRFQPAKIGPNRVRQLVQQQFSFKINDTSSATPKKKP
jgi:protein TonB